MKSESVKSFFSRKKFPGDFVFSIFLLLISLFLLSQLGSETKWIKGTKIFAQPAFWPTVSLVGMTLFAGCHFLSSIYSDKESDWGMEVFFWLTSMEYAVWFLGYVWIVPYLGYLPATVLLSLLLTYRVGYRGRNMFLAATATATAIVVVFKGLLSVKIPGGMIYEYLPDGIRNFMILNL